jgi:tetratricopeptide (TPR) repeat protein
MPPFSHESPGNAKKDFQSGAVPFYTPIMPTELGPPHSHFVSAAEGWTELGNLPEARMELDRIAAVYQKHPCVLEARWKIAARAQDWAVALALARALLDTAPEAPTGWLHHSYSLRRAPGGGVQAAWDALLPALDKFPALAVIPYNLACYACQLGQLDQARSLLRRALELSYKPSLKQMALQDPDLQPLWPEIPGL